MTLPLQTYLAEVHRLWSTGAATDETSYYPPLHSLLGDLGRKFKPKVFCLSQPRDTGAGRPDFYLFTANQLPKAKSLRDPIPDAPPERGVVEAKKATADVDKRIETKQIGDYLRHYGLVLVTNYRDFALVGRGPQGERHLLERFQLAASEEAFRQLTAHPAKAANELNTRLIEFLTRVLLHSAPLAQPKDLAWFLASYARDALARVEQAGDLPALAAVRTALEQALGLEFEGDKGEHFFRSTLVQTLFYGVFSAWVLWSRQQVPGSRARFDWHAAAWSLHVPMVQSLFNAVATPERLGPLGLVEVLDWAAAALNRVERPAFFAKFEEAQAVQYFYEPFLEAFDPELRKQLGVWYTPPEIVKYMVARVDAALRSELDLPDGLADPNVYILDPCCGTGSYLVEVMRRIERTLREKGGDALLAHDLKQAAMTRVFGFEIMPAPFVIAHWQIGALLHSLGVALDDARHERAGIYLTNALTGWEPPAGPKQQMTFAYPEFEHERDAAAHVKRDAPILVILGNPPYNAFAGVSPQEEGGLVDLYKKGLVQTWGVKKFNLDDLYVRFFRVAERRIADGTGRGIVCFISNFSVLGDPSFVVMRQRLAREFDSIWIDCMNGDSRETGKLTPQGDPDPSVFSTEHNREGIRVGTAITMLIRKARREKRVAIRYRDFWGVTKREALLTSLAEENFTAQYERSIPKTDNRFSFRPLAVKPKYLTWPSPIELCAAGPVSGLQEMRHGALMDIDRDRLVQRARRYFDPRVSWSDLKAARHPMTIDAGAFNAESARPRILDANKFSEAAIRRYALYPFDVRWCYHTTQALVWNRPRPTLVSQSWAENRFFVTRMMAERPREGRAVLVTPVLPDYHLLRPNAVAIPIQLRNGRRLTPRDAKATRDLFGGELVEEQTIANLSRKARDYLASLHMSKLDGHASRSELIWMHALAIGHAPAYLAEHAAGISQDWPRIPLPAKRAQLEASAALGRQLAALLDTESPVSGISTGRTRRELQTIGPVSRVGGGALRPRELEITAGWGHGGKGGVTMPGKGKRVERDYTSEERAPIIDGAAMLDLSETEAFAILGATTSDVYLNDAAYWSNIPANVWDYTIGGYQVIKKWLSYRELDLVGRALTADETRYVTEMARRIASILLLQPTLDANYRAAIADTYPWPRD